MWWYVGMVGYAVVSCGVGVFIGKAIALADKHESHDSEDGE